jgi:cell division protease FtsH
MSKNGKPSPRQSQKPENNPRRDDNFQWMRATKTLFFWLVVLVFAIWISMRYSMETKVEQPISFAEFVELLEQGKFKSANIEGKQLRGELNEPKSFGVGTQPLTKVLVTLVTLPQEPSFETAQDWHKNYGVNLSFKQKSLDWWSYLLNLMPWILLAVFWLFLLRRMQGGGVKGIFS